MDFEFYHFHSKQSISSIGFPSSAVLESFAYHILFLLTRYTVYNLVYNRVRDFREAKIFFIKSFRAFFFFTDLNLRRYLL